MTTSESLVPGELYKHARRMEENAIVIEYLLYIKNKWEPLAGTKYYFLKGEEIVHYAKDYVDLYLFDKETKFRDEEFER